MFALRSLLTALLVAFLAPRAVLAMPPQALHDLRPVPSPAASGSAEPDLAVGPDGRVWMSWLETRPGGGHALRGARLEGDVWSRPFTIAEGDSFFANWADFPTLLAPGGDRLVAHYLWKVPGGTYAYEVRLVQSQDGGRTWSRDVVPHRDGTPTEHGFVSLIAAPEGARAVWLDGRNGVRDSAGHVLRLEEGMADMTLRTATLDARGALAGERALDGRVCDCCQTAAVAIQGGALVAYRDRSPEEIRDIALVRYERGRWSEPYPLHADGWKIAGCPVNGPALDAAGPLVAAAWFTGARDTSRVDVAFSLDNGHRFGPPVRVDGGNPLGRVDVALVPGSGDALVSWLEVRDQEARVQVRRVSGRGTMSEPMTIARVPSARASGFPRVVYAENRVALAWTESGKPSHVRTAVANVEVGFKGTGTTGARADDPATELSVPRARTVPRAGFQEGVTRWRVAHEAEILQEFAELLRLPNVASDSVNIRRNADALVALLRKRGLETALLESPGSPPAVYGELKTPGARRTLVLYAHYDGQPVVPREWTGDPWQPVLRDRPLDRGGREMPWPKAGERADPEARLYARAAGDDKAPIIALLAALDAIAAERLKRSVHLKVFLEGEEEAGSQHLRAMLEMHRDRLKADAWIFCDGPMHPSRRPQLVFGVRGVVGLDLTVYGPARPLHSGHYGNWAPNPIARLTELLASLRDGDGRILIEGFENDVRPLSAAERAAVAAMPDPGPGLLAELQLAAPEPGGQPIAERVMRPTINFRGVRAGGVGETATNAIPAEARASIDFRLVPDQTPDGVRKRVEDHLRSRGWEIVDAPPDSATRRAHERIVRLVWDTGYPAYRTPLDAPFATAVARTMEAALGQPVLRTPTLGGSLPIPAMSDVLGVPIIVLPIANHDNNQHAANENLRLQNLWDGIDVMAGLLVGLGQVWR